MVLLADRSPLSIGATAAAFNFMCPNRLELIHQHYRRLCRTLPDADEWGQTNLLELLSRYARCMLPAPFVKSTEVSRAGEETPKEVDADEFIDSTGLSRLTTRIYNSS